MGKFEISVALKIIHEFEHWPLFVPSHYQSSQLEHEKECSECKVSSGLFQTPSTTVTALASFLQKL